MTYEGEQKADGIIFPQKHRTFMWEEDGSIGDYVTDIRYHTKRCSFQTRNKKSIV